MALSWCFEDQSTEFTESVLEQLGGGDEAYVPAVWPLEIANAMLVAERRKLMSPATTASLLEQFMTLPIRTEPSSMPARVFERVAGLARRYRLSAYDASYLELALRLGLPLATVDRSLRAAARSAGVRHA